MPASAGARGPAAGRAQFQAKGRIEARRIESERGQILRLANPFEECRVTRGSEPVAGSRDAVRTLPTAAGDVFEYSAAAPRRATPREREMREERRT